MSGRIRRLHDIFVLSHHFVTKIVIHLFLWGKVWAELWTFARNDKQNVGRKQGSVEVGVEVSYSYSNKTYSSVWVLSSSPDLMRMPYSVELTIGFFYPRLGLSRDRQVLMDQVQRVVEQSLHPPDFY